MKEPSTHKVLSEVFGFLFAEDHVAVSSHINIRVMKKFHAAHFHNIFFVSETDIEVFITKVDKIGEGRFVGVPVAATAIFQFSYFQLRLRKYAVQRKNA